MLLVSGLLLGILTSLQEGSPPASVSPPEILTLENGLRAGLAPYSPVDQVAIVVVIATGEERDPEEAPGLAHYLEHLALTAGVGDEPPTPVEQLFERYPQGSNGQTLWDHMQFYWVFPKERWQAELRLLRQRLDGLHIAEADCAREIPRLEIELHNMFTRWPQLAPGNWMRTCLRGGPQGPRRGGEVARLKEVSVARLQRRWQRVTHPSNLIVSLCGDFDPEEARELIPEIFADLQRPDLEPPSTRNRRLRGGKHDELDDLQPHQSMALFGVHAPSMNPHEFAEFAAAATVLRSLSPGEPRIDYLPVADPFIFMMYGERLEEESTEETVRRWSASLGERPIGRLLLRSFKDPYRYMRGEIPRNQLAWLSAENAYPLVQAAYGLALRQIRGDAEWWLRFEERIRAMDQVALTQAMAKLLTDESRLLVSISNP